jgi:hypothetical protein
MIYTKEKLVEMIKKNDVDFFKNVYEDYGWEDTDYEPCENKTKELWYLNWGDGNDIYVAIEFVNEKVTFLLEGTYSSHDSTHWDKVSFGIPFEFKETRYRAATIADIRDMKIEEVLDKSQTEQ